MIYLVYGRDSEWDDPFIHISGRGMKRGSGKEQ